MVGRDSMRLILIWRSANINKGLTKAPGIFRFKLNASDECVPLVVGAVRPKIKKRVQLSGRSHFNYFWMGNLETF